MPRPPPSPSKYFCHPESIVAGSSRLEPYPVTAAKSDLLEFSQAIQSHKVVRGDLSKYTKLFEESDVFIRVVTARPLQVRTFLAEKDTQNPIFFEYPSQVPSMTFFTRRSFLLDQRKFTCNHCRKTYACYFYFRKRLSPSERRSWSFYSQHSGTGSAKDTTEGSKSSPDRGTGRSRTAVMRELVRMAERYVSQGAKWVHSKLRRKSRRLPVIIGQPVGTGSDLM